MPCGLKLPDLRAYLEGSLSPEEAGRVESHLEHCAECQSLQVMAPGFQALLSRQLPRERVREAFRNRVRQTLGLVQSEGAAETAWWQRSLASPWMPRLAMALVLALLVLVPGRGLLRAPALAQEAVRSHDFHAASCDGPLPSCCTDLALSEGARLPAPAAGCVIPDLRPLGLHLLVSSRCAGKAVVARLAYRDEQGALFSLYITDQLTEEFHALHPREVRGRLQAQYGVAGSRVALWEQGGFLYTWIGPQASSHTREALAILQRHNDGSVSPSP